MATLSRPMSASHQKLAEKLLILNHRGDGMITRLYQIKKACANPASKPPFLSEKSLEPAIKYIQRKFPNIDVKGGGSQMNHVNAIKSDIVKTLQLYYFTFVDILDFKDHVSELLTTFDTCQVELDISTCFDLTKNYLELISKYCTLLILLSMVDDRKAVLGLYNVAHELLNNQHEASFPRLSHMIIEYEHPFKKLCDDFVPHSRCLMSALVSLVQIYPRRNLAAEQWRAHQLLSLTSSASHLANPAKTDAVSVDLLFDKCVRFTQRSTKHAMQRHPQTPCEYLSVEQMQRWIIYCCTLMHNNLADQETYKLWLQALHDGWILRLHRDEVLHVHNFLQQFFESFKGYNKRVAEIKEALAIAQQFSPAVHRERRKYLRTALKELCLILNDQPGLLGPKALFVVMGMSLARDEVLWLMRHAHYTKMHNMLLTGSHANGAAGKTNQKHQQAQQSTFDDDLIDRYLPELLFRIEEMRLLIRRHSSTIIMPYHVAFLSGFDVQYLDSLLQGLSTAYPEEQSIILSSFINMLTDLPAIPQGVRNGNLLLRKDSINSSSATSTNSASNNNNNDVPIPDLRALRLDWMRMQAMSASGQQRARVLNSIAEHKQLAFHLNCIMFHSRLVDDLDMLTNDVSDLSDYCFYPVLLEEQFQLCLEFPAQTRNIIAFPLVCAHFLNAYHELCPEEKKHIGDRSLQYVNHFLEEMAKEAKNIITTICDEECIMRDMLLPKHAAVNLMKNMEQQSQHETRTTTSTDGGTVTTTTTTMSKKQRRANQQAAPVNLPGHESYRRTREELTTMDKLHMALTELTYSINFCPKLVIAQHVFSPREYLTAHLEGRFRSTLVGMSGLNAETQTIAKPTELLSSIRAYLSVMQTVERYVQIDMTRIFNNVLLQETYPQDSSGDPTLTHLYTTWYLDNLLRRATVGTVCYSPRKQAFVNMPPPASTLIGTASTTGASAAAAAGVQIVGVNAGALKAEDYASLNEIYALCEILGPYGMKHLVGENVAWNIAVHTAEIKRIVLDNRETLAKLRTRFENADEVRDLIRRVVGADDLIKRLVIIGILLCFRRVCQATLAQVLERRTPYLMFCMHDLSLNRPDNNNGMKDTGQPLLNNNNNMRNNTLNPNSLLNGLNPTAVINELLGSAGFDTPIDSSLVVALRLNKIEGTEEDHNFACLLLAFMAFFIGRIVKMDPGAYFDANLEAYSNNVHCLSETLAVLFPTIFYMCDKNDVEDRMREFLALSSSTILRHNIVDIVHSVGGGGGGGDSNNSSSNSAQNSSATGGGGGGTSTTTSLAAKKDAYILLGILVAETKLTQDVIECCFPYDLLRTTYQIVLSHSANAATANR